jgi:uncharacterized oligopeptide transporter (OPT) family protein
MPSPTVRQAAEDAGASGPPRWRFLPAAGSRRYHLMLGALALLVLGPLCGVTCAYMAFSLGFMVASQVLAGILGSTVTYGYGVEGKHGANYMQTMAASVGSMSGMGVLIQAMVWLEMPQPPSWVLMLYMGCIGMFGIGVGMLFTPILVDHLQLEYPSGHAVANILRALTDARLLRRSVAKLGGGTGLGVAMAAVVPRVGLLSAIELSASTVGAGMIVGSRIAVPVLVMGGAGVALVPRLRAAGWLGPDDPFRKIGFLIALAMIMGAAIVDLTLIGVEAVRRVRARAGAGADPRDAGGGAAGAGGLGAGRLLAWVVFWATALVLVGTRFLHQPAGFLLFAVGLAFVFVFVNGISMGISDNNPISSAFVVCVLLMSALGLRDPVVGMMAAGVLFVACTVGVDMQQDRSTGWRLRSNRTIQFRYQAVGIVMGAITSVAFAELFMRAYPVLRIDTFAHPKAKAPGWQSTMTYKFVGAIRDIGHLAPHKVRALLIGLAIGFGLEVARKLTARSARMRAFRARGRTGFATGWLLDAVVLASPYALSFGGFFDLTTCIWFAFGGVLTSAIATVPVFKRPPAESGDTLPEDMSTTSLIGGGLIAGESIYTLVAGIYSLLGLLGR